MQNSPPVRHVSHFLTAFCFSFLILYAGVSMAGEIVNFPDGYPQTISGRSDSLGPSGSDSYKSPDVNGNQVTLINGTVIGYIVGAVNLLTGDNDPVTNNIVTIGAGGIAQDAVFGGYGYGEANGNSVTVTDNGQVNGLIYGGYGYGRAVGNSVSIGENATVSGLVFGGWSSVSANNNTITIEGTVATGNVYGGQGGTEALNNSVTIKGTVATGNIYGGWGGTKAFNNSVTINGGTVERAVMGGYSQDGDATNNRVVIVGGSISGGDDSVYGGYSGGGVADGNSVSMTNGTIEGVLFAGSGATGASGNSAAIQGGTVSSNVVGGYSANGDSTDNIITISGGVMNDSVLAGYSANGNASNNLLTVSGGTIEGAAYSGYSAGGNADGNTLLITGGTVEGNVYGGSSTGGNAGGNTVAITGGTVGGDICAGYSAGGNATNNSVSISGAPDLSASAIYGGYLADSNSSENAGNPGDVFSGNTFNITSADVAVRGIQNFQTFNFYLPGNTANGDTVLLVSDEADINGSTVNVGVAGNSSPLRGGDKVTLIDAATLSGTPVNHSSDGQGMQGVTLRYNFIIETADNLLTARLEAVEVNEQTKALSEGFISSLVLTRQSADLIADQGIKQAISAAEQAHGLGTFGSVAGGWARYDTGSHVDVSGVSLIAGLAWAGDLTPGRLTLGAFFEYGTGSYDTYNSFSNAADVHGDGRTYHMGGGVLGHMDFNRTDTGRFYAEASVRAGGLHNEYDSHDLRDMQGRIAAYDYSSAYYGLHAGLGYIWNLTENISLDTYGKYFWTHQKGESVTLSTGETIDFDNANSHRLRVGGRLDWALHEQVTPYIGAAYEYEFDGEVNAATNGYVLESPHLRGGTGIGEIGLFLQPAANLPLFFNLGVHGFLGAREGVAGSLNARLYF